LKKIFKILLWVIGSTIAISIIGLFLTYWWISTEWKDYYSDAEMQEITIQINDADNLPENFYLAYDKIYPEQRNRTLRQMSFQAVWFFITNNLDNASNYRQCSSIIATRFIKNKKIIGYHSFDTYILAHGLVKYTNEKKCFDYLYYKSGINHFSYDCFSKPLNELTLNENIELLIRLEYPTYYNNNPDKLAKRMLDYK